MKLFSLLSSALLLSNIAPAVPQKSSSSKESSSSKKSSPKKASKTSRDTPSAGGRNKQFKASSSSRPNIGPRSPAAYRGTTKSSATSNPSKKGPSKKGPSKEGPSKKGPSKKGPPKKSTKSPPPKLYTHPPTPAPANWENFDTDLVVLCADGAIEELSVVYLPDNYPGFQYQWNWSTICRSHGGYITCPLSAPNVCQDKECGFDGEQICCAAFVPLCGLPEGYWIGGNGKDTAPDPEPGHGVLAGAAKRAAAWLAGEREGGSSEGGGDCDDEQGIPCDSFIYKQNVGTGFDNKFGQGTGPDGGYGPPQLWPNPFDSINGDEVEIDGKREGFWGPYVLPVTTRTYTTPSYTDTPAVEVTCDEESWFRGFGGGGKGGAANHCGLREVEYCTGAKCFGNPGERVSFEYECVVKTREGRNIDPLDKPTGAPSPAPVPVTTAPSATPDTAAPTPTEDNPDYDPRLQVCSQPIQIGNSLVCYFVDDISDYLPEPFAIQDNVFVNTPAQLGVNWKRETCLFDVRTIATTAELNQYACSCTERKCMIPEKVPYNKDICPNSWREGADCWYNGCQDPSNKRSVDEPPQIYPTQCSDWCNIFSQADIDDYADYGNTGECPYATFSDGSQCYGANAAFNVPQSDDQNAPVPELCVLEIAPTPPLIFEFNVEVGSESFNWFQNSSTLLAPGDPQVMEGISLGVQVFRTDAFGSDKFLIRDAADNDEFSCDNPWDTTGPGILPADCSCYTWSKYEYQRALPLANFNVTKRNGEDDWWSSPFYPFLEIHGGCAAVGKSVVPNDVYCSSLPGGVCTVEACCFDSASAFDQWEEKEEAIAKQHNFTDPNTCYHNNFYNFPLQFTSAITPIGFQIDGQTSNPALGGGCAELGFAPTSEDMARSCKASEEGVCSICSCCTTTQAEYDKCAEDSLGLYLTPGDQMDTFNWRNTVQDELERYYESLETPQPSPGP